MGSLIASRRDLKFATLTIYGEAANQGVDGQIAVAWVIRNRCRDPRWPNEPEVVCLQANQFSCWLTTDWNAPNLHRMVLGMVQDLPEYRQAESIAGWVLGDFTSYDPTHGANMYHARSVTPSWADPAKKCYEWRDHIFYKV